MFWVFSLQVPVDGMMNLSKYTEILRSRVLPFLQTFTDGKATFQHDLSHVTTQKQSRSSLKKINQHARWAW
jgi:hypothetical protein